MEFWDEIRPVRKNQWDGAMADVRAARYDGLVAFSPTRILAGTGALAGVLIAVILLMLPVSFIRLSNFPLLAFVLALYGAFQGWWRQKDTIKGRRLRIVRMELLPHSLFNYLFVPFVPIVMAAAWQPHANEPAGNPDNFLGSILMLMTIFWIGAAFDYTWEAAHNLVLGRWVGLESDEACQRTLRMWIPREEKHESIQLKQVSFEAGKAIVSGTFADERELRRKLLLLSFVKEAEVINEPQAS